MTPTLSPTTFEPLTAYDRCDRCGAQGRVRVLLLSGSDLVFCGHHAREYDAKLRDLGVEIIVDETATVS
ncbi:MAG: hypothetical protein H0V10_15300 [Geodermatophilaceae bacterium]|nr:hypothetical protein [Geodermatophilaceae bacterium]